MPQKILAQVYPNFEYAQGIGCADIQAEIQKIIQKHNSNFPRYFQIADVKVRKNPFEKTFDRSIRKANRRYIFKLNQKTPLQVFPIPKVGPKYVDLN